MHIQQETTTRPDLKTIEDTKQFILLMFREMERYGELILFFDLNNNYRGSYLVNPRLRVMDNVRNALLKGFDFETQKFIYIRSQEETHLKITDRDTGFSKELQMFCNLTGKINPFSIIFNNDQFINI